jgi:aspartate oxidase
MDRAFALDLLVGTDGEGRRQAAGVVIARIDANGAVVSVGTVTARAVILATGGYGQVFASTSNPPAVTGDGLALALRAGLSARDIEFVQFHPTVLWRGADAVGQQALVSEAVRGEGAILYDAAGERVMTGVHPQEDLAPRDVVASAISRRMSEAPAGVLDHVYLDATHMGERFYDRFPTITAACRSAGIDPARDRIPVAPAAHYVCGGIVADLSGHTAMPGLFAVGEVACTGVHGANRLASNSLTESVVAGTRVGRDLAWELPPQVEPHPVAGAAVLDAPDALLVDPDLRPTIRAAMSRHVGVLRRPEGLAAAAEALAVPIASTEPSRRSWEATNILTVAAAVVAAADARTESRGCHRRTDHPEPREVWLTHLDVHLAAESATDAVVTVTGVPPSGGYL